jgi:hypothetical protein
VHDRIPSNVELASSSMSPTDADANVDVVALDVVAFVVVVVLPPSFPIAEVVDGKEDEDDDDDALLAEASKLALDGRPRARRAPDLVLDAAADSEPPPPLSSAAGGA